MAKTATKTDPAKWEQAKKDAKATREGKQYLQHGLGKGLA
tara:strand:+ start:794 stop:913 length:120 start_codon:yes stop_codon:yes gene_type:complete